MDWQQLVSLLIVGAAAVLLARSKFRRRKFNFGETHCALAASSQPGSQCRIVYHARKGRRPEVLVKMR